MNCDIYSLPVTPFISNTTVSIASRWFRLEVHIFKKYSNDNFLHNIYIQGDPKGTVILRSKIVFKLTFGPPGTNKTITNSHINNPKETGYKNRWRRKNKLKKTLYKYLYSNTHSSHYYANVYVLIGIWMAQGSAPCCWATWRRGFLSRNPRRISPSLPIRTGRLWCTHYRRSGAPLPSRGLPLSLWSWWGSNHCILRTPPFDNPKEGCSGTLANGTS